MRVKRLSSFERVSIFMAMVYAFLWLTYWPIALLLTLAIVCYAWPGTKKHV